MPAATRDDLRNVAIVAHVDHGKTTLVDAMLWQSGAFSAHQAEEGAVDERVMDSMDLEREKGITILAKNTAVRHGDGRCHHQHHRHPRPRRLRRRGRARAVDGRRRRCCSSTRARARCRRPGSCCARRSQQQLPVVLVINKVDRPDARIAEVVDETYELFLDLDADERPDRVPDRLLLGQGRPGLADPARRRRDAGQRRTSSRCSSVLEHGPRPDVRRRRTAAGARHQPRRLAVPRPPRAVPGPQRRRSSKGQTVAWCRADGTQSSGSRSPSC